MSRLFAPVVLAVLAPAVAGAQHAYLFLIR